MTTNNPTASPLFHSDAPVRAGRPPLAKTQVVRQGRALGFHDFAFVRAVLQGLDLRDSFNRYVSFSEPLSDLRFAQSRFRRLLTDILDAGATIYKTLPKDAQRAQDLRCLRKALRETQVSAVPATASTSEAPSPAPKIPSLEEWVVLEEVDIDFYSEAELIAEYQGAFGLDRPLDDGDSPGNARADAAKTPQNATQTTAIGVATSDGVKRRISALNRLEPRLAALPSPADKIGLWFAHSVTSKLSATGLVSLADLVNHLNVRGYRWHTHTKGIGQKKSQQIIAWLNQQSGPFEHILSGSVATPQQRLSIERRNQLGPGLSLVLPPVFGIVPLERLALPPSLDGQRGVFRSGAPNTLEASTDLEAIQVWLQHHRERISTHRSYRKEAERFLLFCVHILRKPLSSVSTPDCLQYRAFLLQVPQDWIHPMPVGRDDGMWRPFRGQPEPSSQKQALVILQAMFEGLRNANYLVANPFKEVMKGFKLPASAVDLDRSLSQAEWRLVLEQAQAMGDSFEGRRMRLLLVLLVSTGLRLDELANASRENMKFVSVDGESEKAWILNVVGKRDKPRVVPLSGDLVGLIELHALDAVAANEVLLQEQQARKMMPSLAGAALPSPAANSHAPELTKPAGTPLIYALHTTVAQWADIKGVATLQEAPVEKTPNRLSASGTYRTLKRFFGRCALAARDTELDPLHLQAASTHWLRHSFGREAAVSGVPIEIISQAMGHASLTTTSIYLTQERSRMIKELRKMHASVGAD